jgi:hypothetical protein
MDDLFFLFLFFILSPQVMGAHVSLDHHDISEILPGRLYLSSVHAVTQTRVLRQLGVVRVVSILKGRPQIKNGLKEAGIEHLQIEIADATQSAEQLGASLPQMCDFVLQVTLLPFVVFILIRFRTTPVVWFIVRLGNRGRRRW